MSLRVTALLVSLLAGLVLGAVAPAGQIANTLAGRNSTPLKHYDPLP